MSRLYFSSLRFYMILALLLIPGGILMILYTDPIVRFIGKIDFAENFFVGGGTYTFVKLIGLAVSVLAFMYLIGGLDMFIGGTVGRVVPGFQ